MARLQGKTALITGGTSGIGFAAARLFQAEGARVVVTGRNPERLEQAREALGADALVLNSEAGSLEAVDALLAQVKQHSGRIDVLFLNAGIAPPTPIDAVTEAQFDEIIDVNFKSVFFTVQKALPLLEKGAAVIVTTSITNRSGSANFPVYGASKAALRSLVQSLALVLVGRGIRINAINPGPIDTGGFNRIPVPGEVLQAIKGDIEGRSPMKRFGSPEEVAKTALFLASDDSSYITGEEIVVDGGISLVCLP